MTSQELRDSFELVEQFVAEDHFQRSLVRCKECGQLYFQEFYEYWNDDGDWQHATYVPVSTNEQIEKLRQTDQFSLLQFSPRLQCDFRPSDECPRVFWMRDEHPLRQTGNGLLSNEEERRNRS